MKKFTVFCLFLLCSIISGYSQSAKELVSRYRAALKKTADSSSLQSLRADAIFTIKKITLPVSIYCKLPSLTRVEMTFQNIQMLQVSNDSLKWEFNPMLDENKVTRIEKNESGLNSSGTGSFDFINYDLLNYQERNHDLSVKGKQKMDSLEVYVLELRKSDKSKTKFFVNKRNSLIYKIEDDRGYRYFSDYRDVSDYLFPMTMRESSPKEQIDIRFTNVSINIPIADSLFIIPQDAINKRKEENKAVNTYVARADSLYRNEKYVEAIASYNQAIQIDGADFLAYNGRGLSKLMLKEYYEAIADFSKALELKPSAYTARNNIGLAKYYLGDKNGALKDYAKALELNPNYVVTLKNRGLLYMDDEKYDMASQDLAAAAKLNPDEGFVHFKLGVALAELEKFKEALEAYDFALRKSYATAEVYNYRGVSEFRLEKYDTACISFMKAVELNPENLQYIENCGRSFYESGDHNLASKQFESYLSKKKDNPSIYNLNGLCKYREENYKGAIKDFSKAIELNGKEAVYYDNRAAAKELIEDYEGAISDYGESIRVYPNDASVFYKRGLIKIATSKKMEGCLDLATANEMKYEPAKEAIFKNCN